MTKKTITYQQIQIANGQNPLFADNEILRDLLPAPQVKIDRPSNN
jgi:hypothetical protein